MPRELTSENSSAFHKLNTAWERAGNILREIRTGSPVRLVVNEPEIQGYLSFCKWHGQWRIVFCEDDELPDSYCEKETYDLAKPIGECRLFVRQSLVPKFRELHAAAVRVAEESRRKAFAAADNLDQMLDDIEPKLHG